MSQNIRYFYKILVIWIYLTIILNRNDENINYIGVTIMTLNEIVTMAENWRSNDSKRYSVEFYSKIIADLLDRKAWAKLRYPYKASYTDGLINWLNARYPHLIVTRFVYDLVENIK